MIARLWSDRATVANAPLYAEHFRTHVLPSLRALAGYRGTMLLERQTGDVVEITVLTKWASLDAVRAFAGEDVEHAVVAAEAARVLIDFDLRARHEDLVIDAHG